MHLTNEEIFAKDKQDYMPVFARYDIVLDHGEGTYLFDTNNKKYIDFLAGIAVNVVGNFTENIQIRVALQFHLFSKL